MLFPTLFGNFNLTSIFHSIDDKNFDDEAEFLQELNSANGEAILFQGLEQSLNITDSGNLYNLDQK